MSSDEDNIRARVQTWQSATKAGDIQTALGPMTDDVVFLVPGRPPMRVLRARRELDGHVVPDVADARKSPRTQTTC